MTVEEALRSFGHSVESGRVAQGYVIVGPPRGEAMAFAKQALQLIFCEARRPEPSGRGVRAEPSVAPSEVEGAKEGEGGKEPCGECRNCRKVQEQAHPDILWVEPEKKSRAISIEQVRDLQRMIYQTSFAGSWKACVMTAADRMGDPAANAFLKTLEEPPARSVFFLLTDSPQSLLPTIVSRCQRVVVAGDPARLPDAWRQALLAVLAESSGAGALAAFSRADRVDKILKEMKKQAEIEETEAAAAGGQEIDDETLDARVNARYREMRTGMMQFLLRWYRDLLMVVCEMDDSLVHHRDSLDLLRKKARSAPYRQALRNVATIEAMNRQFEGNIPESSVLGLGFCRLT